MIRMVFDFQLTPRGTPNMEDHVNEMKGIIASMGQPYRLTLLNASCKEYCPPQDKSWDD